MEMTEKTLYAKGSASSRGAVIRVLPGFDIIEGIEEACRKIGIKCGAVVSCIGSLKEASLMIVALTDSNKVGAVYSEPIVVPGPLQLISAQGTIGQDEKGEVMIHLHGSFCNTDGRIYGGHLVRGKNRILISCETVITEVSDARVVRAYDSEVEFSLFMSTEEGKAL